DPIDVHHQRGPGEPQSHQRQQRMAASDDLRILVRTEELDRLLDRPRPRVLEGRRDHCPPPPLACWIARHTCSGVTERWMSVTPRWDSASITEFTTAND